MNIEVLRKITKLIAERAKLSSSECISVVGCRTVVYNYGKSPTNKATLKRIEAIDREIESLKEQLYNA